MGNTLASLNIMIGANSAHLKAELATAGKGIHRFAKTSVKQFATISKAALGVGKSMGKFGLASTAALGVVTYAVTNTLTSIEELRRQAASISMPIEQFQAYAFAMQAAGLTSEQFADVIKDLSVKISEFAATGGGSMTDFFLETGESVEQWRALNPAEQFERFSAAIRGMPQSESRRFLDEINDSAALMFDTLVGSGGEFQRNADLAREMGLVMSKEVVANAHRAKMEIHMLTALTGGIWTQTIAASSPAITFITKGVRTWVQEAAKAEGGAGNVGKIFALAIVDGASQATKAVETFVNESALGIDNLVERFGGDFIDTDDIDRKIETMTAQRNKIEQIHIRFKDDIPMFESEDIWQGTKEELERYEELDVAIKKLLAQKSKFVDFSGARVGLAAARKEIVDLKTELPTDTTIPVTVAATTTGFGKIKTMYDSQIKSAQQYIQMQELMVNNSWSQERAVLENLLVEYKTWLDKKRIAKAQYDLLVSAAEKKYDTSISENGSITGFAKEAAQLQQNWQRRLAIQAAGEQAAAVQESFAYQDRLTALNLSYDNAVKAAAGNEAAMLDIDAQYLSAKELLWQDHQLTLQESSLGFWENLAKQVQESSINFEKMWAQSFDRFKVGIGDATAEAIVDQQSAADVMKTTIKAVEKQMISYFVQLGVQEIMAWALKQKLATTGATVDIARAAFTGKAIAASYAAPAALASLSSFGGNAIPASTGIASTMAVSSGIAGMAHDGIDNIPNEGTWLLDKGERVVDSRTNEDLKRFLSISASRDFGMIQPLPYQVPVQQNPAKSNAQTINYDNAGLIALNDSLKKMAFDNASGSAQPQALHNDNRQTHVSNSPALHLSIERNADQEIMSVVTENMDLIYNAMTSMLNEQGRDWN